MGRGHCYAIQQFLLKLGVVLAVRLFGNIPLLVLNALNGFELCGMTVSS